MTFLDLVSDFASDEAVCILIHSHHVSICSVILKLLGDINSQIFKQGFNPDKTSGNGFRFSFSLHDEQVADLVF